MRSAVTRAAADQLDPETMAVTVVGDRAQVAPALEELGLAPVEVFEHEPQA